MTDDFRLIVTGSREYDDHLSLRAALAKVFNAAPPGSVLVVVCGGEDNPDYSTKADQIAQDWAQEMMERGLPVRLESHPADWEGRCRDTCDHGPRQTWKGASICPAAGPYRNQEMVSLGADRALGALRTGTRSTGTKDCLNRLARAAIPIELLVQGSGRGLPEGLLRPRHS